MAQATTKRSKASEHYHQSITILTLRTTTSNQQPYQDKPYPKGFKTTSNMSDNIPNLPAVRKKRSKLPLEDLLEYKARGLTPTEIGKLHGITASAVCHRLKDLNIESLENFERHKDKVFEFTQRKLLGKLSEVKLNKMGGLQLITGAAILDDKIRLHRGQSTSNVAIAQIEIDYNKRNKVGDGSSGKQENG